MAVGANNKVGFKIGSTSPASIDLSDWVTSYSQDVTYDTLEITAMGDTSHRVVKGLFAGSISIDVLIDGDNDATLQTFNDLVGQTAYFKAIQDSGTAIGATNPLYTGQIFVNGITPINGAVADVKMMSLTFSCQSEITVAETGTW
jgi:hypothetical protein